MPIDIADLAADFWTWRASQQPRSRDDLPRISRPAGWRARFSAADVARYRRQAADFATRLADCHPGDDRAAAVDIRLLGSALARVHWELDVVRAWQQQPSFYVDQSLGAVFDVLTPLGVDADRLSTVRELLRVVPEILDTGLENLAGQAVREFTELTITELQAVEDDVATMLAALGELGPDGWSAADNDELKAVGEQAGAALGAFRDHLASTVADLPPATPIGRAAFADFLRTVALVPYTPDQILEIGHRETHRAVALELLERNRNGSPARSRPTSRFKTDAQQSAAQAAAEQQIRDFYLQRGILSQPKSLRHYHTHPFPAYLSAIGWVGMADDLTAPERLDDNGAAYFPPPDGPLGYFYAANAHDPRAGIIHEGAHYQQLALAWRHPRQIRRYYYDSTVNEGIAFYNEELMLASGLFDDAPHTREIVYNFMRLRALRVVVDVRLALGELTIGQAADLLEHSVPMDAETAAHEAAFFAATPGQAMTYQIGKTQILALLSDASQREGFTLQAFHDRLWREGNVPIALQRWELLDDSADLDALRIPIEPEASSS